MHLLFMRLFAKNTTTAITITPADFEQAFMAYYPRLVHFAERFVAAEEAEDIVQNCFMRLWEKRNEITPTNLSGLLFQMVRNECLNHIKHQYIASTESIDDLLANTGSEALYWQDMAPDADARLLQQDLEAHINEALMHISDKARELFLLSRNEGLSPKELAERYDISRQAVEKHIHAAIDALKKYLPKEDLWVALLYITLFTQ